MDAVLHGQEQSSADDVIIHSLTWEEHVAHIRAVLQCLKNARLTAKYQKYKFGMRQCSFLGHIVGGGVVQPDSDKVKAVELFPTPRTKKQVRCFLGLTGYYRRFIPQYARIATPLTDLTKDSAPNIVVWSPECDKAFQPRS